MSFHRAQNLRVAWANSFARGDGASWVPCSDPRPVPFTPAENFTRGAEHANPHPARTALAVVCLFAAMFIAGCASGAVVSGFVAGSLDGGKLPQARATLKAVRDPDLLAKFTGEIQAAEEKAQARKKLIVK